MSHLNFYSSCEDADFSHTQSEVRINVHSQSARVLGRLVYSFVIILAFLLLFFQNEFYGFKAIHQVQSSVKSLQSLYVLDACSSSTKSKTECCTDKNFPVLGGIDVVALRQVHKGNPPVLGTIEFPAALPTKAGTFVFLFSSKENQLLFIEDPWRYTPKWGGFDASEIATNNAIKGENGKTMLGMNTNPSEWMWMDNERPLMFGSSEGKSNFLLDSIHWEDKGNEKWIGWWGSLEDGPFNTQCLTGPQYSELQASTERYKRGELPLGLLSVRDRFLQTLPRKQIRNAVASARVMTVDPSGKVSAFLVEDGTGKGFSLSSDLLEMEALPTALLASDRDISPHQSFLYVADVKKQQLVRFSILLEQRIILEDFGDHPLVALTWSNSDMRLYFASDNTIFSFSPVEKHAVRKLYCEIPTGQITDLMADDSKLYYVDKEANTVKYTMLSSSTPVWTTVATMDDPISLIFPWMDDQLFIITEANAVYKSFIDSSGTSDGTVKLFDWPEPILGFQIAGSTLFMGVPGRVISAPSATLDSSGKPPVFEEVLTEIEMVKKGMVVKSWPAPNGLSFTANTKYTERGDKPVFSDYPWLAGTIIEPHLLTTLRVTDPKDPSVASYTFTMQGESTTGTERQITLTETGIHTLILREIDLDGVVMRELRTFLVCKYVRREIKTLTDEDREAFLDGLEIMVTISQEEGTKKYGANFKNNEYFTHMHNVLAGARDCDHLHQGRGFLTNHLSLTLMFEQSLQMVNPALTVPYWDYTVESAILKKDYGMDFDMLWEISPIFRPDWFGDAHNDEQTVIEGRWAYKLKIPDDQWDNQRHNSYGMMRSPWNNNPSPWVQRFNEFAGMSVFRYNQGWPMCRDHFDLSVNYPDFSSYIAKMPGWPHGTVHGVLGGTVNFDHSLEKLAGILKTKDMDQIRLRSPHIPKELWRRGLTECPEYCGPETPLDDCKCTCPQEKIDALDTDEDLFLFYMSSALNSRMLDYYDKETLINGIKVICNSGFIMGDQEESASPADPIFWPVHPTVERLYQWTLLNGGFDDMSWPEEEGNYNQPIYLGSNQKCSGHNPQDRLPWAVILDGSTVPSNYLNIEMMSLLDITGDYQLPYVYDNFDWDHCIEQGYSFKELGLRLVSGKVFAKSQNKDVI